MVVNGLLTLAELFQMEGISSFEIDPSGRLLVFESDHPYAERRTFGTFHDRHTASLEVCDLQGKSAPLPLISKENPSHATLGEVEGMWLGGFSPRGTRLAIYWLDDGRTRAGAFEFASSRLTAFEFTPDIPQYPAPPSFAWISEKELVYGTLVDGRQPIFVDERRFAGLELGRLWESAWKGKQVTASVTDTHAHEHEVPQPGVLVRINASTGHMAPIADGRFMHFSLSPDRSFLAVLRRGGPRPLKADTLVQTSVDVFAHDALLIDLTGTSRPFELCPGHEVARNTFAWGLESDELTFFAWPKAEARERGSYFVYETTNQKLTKMEHRGLDLALRSPAWAGLPAQALPAGNSIIVPAHAQAVPEDRPAFTMQSEKERRLDWYQVRADGKSAKLTASLQNVRPFGVMTENHALLVLADGKIWSLTDGDSPADLTGAKLPDITQVLLVREWVVALNDEPVLGFISLKTGETRTTTVPEEVAKGLSTQSIGLIGKSLAAVSPETHTAVALRTTHQGCALIKALGQDVIELWPYNGRMKEIKAPRTTQLSYESPNGSELTASLILPHDWEPGRMAPTVVDVYPSGAKRIEIGAYLFKSGIVLPAGELALFSSLGYIVLHPPAPKELLRTPDGNPLGGWGKAVELALDAAVSEGFVDPERIGLHGFSQGSWSALSVLAQTDRFKAAVVGSGLTDFVSAYGTRPVSLQMFPDDYPFVGQHNYRFERAYPGIGSPPWDDPEGYVRASPIFHVRNISTPVLLMHTDFDTATFPIQQFDELFTALMRVGKRARYVRYWGEAHGPRSPANIRDWWARKFAWFDDWCDVSRDTEGKVLYDKEMPRSRGDEKALSPEDFLKWEWFFGPDPSAKK